MYFPFSQQPLPSARSLASAFTLVAERMADPGTQPVPRAIVRLLLTGALDPAALAADSFLDRVADDLPPRSSDADAYSHRERSHRDSRSDRDRDSYRERDSYRSSRDDRDRDRDRERDYRRRSRSPDGGGSHRSSSRRDYDSRGDGSRRHRDYDDRGDRRGSSRRYDDDYRGGGGGGGYDRPPPRDYYDDRRGGPRGGGGGGYGRGPPRRGYSPPRGGGGGPPGSRRGRGGPTFEGFGVYDEREARRSPTPEDTIPISKRKRPFTAWDVKPAGFETYTTIQAKMTGSFIL